MSDRKFLLTADARTIAAAVKTYGTIALCHNGLTEMQNAQIATKAITNLDNEVIDLKTLMCSSVKDDGSWESVKFDVLGTGTTMCQIVRIVKYRQFKGMEYRPDQIKYGPLIPVAKADALLTVLNS